MSDNTKMGIIVVIGIVLVVAVIAAASLYGAIYKQQQTTERLQA